MAVLSLSPCALAETPPFPEGAEALEASLLAQLDPQTRVWIQQEGAREAASGGASEATASRAVASTFGSSSGHDPMALVMLVMMESARSVQADLEASMAEMKQINDAKAALRQAAQQRETGTADLRTAPSEAQVRPSPGLREALIGPPPRPDVEYEARSGYVTNDLDALRRSSELMSVRMQNELDQRAGVMSALSNVMKKISATRAGLVGNLDPTPSCKAGFVWREARPGDLVCVPPDAHARTAQENADAPNRIDPAGAYGPNTCVSGYVWRDAFEGDLVCVVPSTRDLVAEENRLAATRRAGD